MTEIQKLLIDNEFRELVRPLLKDEYLTLESNLLADGCRDPITVWNGVIVDGHNRYEICTRHHIPFSTVTHDFSSREEAIAWICANQLGRRNISEETRKYLIGKRYEAEKIISYRKNSKGANQYTPEPDEENLPYETYDSTQRSKQVQPATDPLRTSERLAAEYHLAHGTVEKYGTYSKALDKIAQKDPSMMPRILSGRYKISHRNIVALSKMSAPEIKKFNQQMLLEKKAQPFVPYSVARSSMSDLSQPAPPPIVLHTNIKTMPEFDPDAEVTGLTLTIPSWTSSIERTRNHSNLQIVSLRAKSELEEALLELQINIEELLAVLSKE